jgi:protein SCO1
VSFATTDRRRSAARRTLFPLLAAVLLSACAGPSKDDAGQGMDLTRSGFAGTTVQRPYPLPGERFSDTEGRAFVPARDATAPVTLVFFGYTHCPDVCNVVLANIASALRRTDERVRERVQLLFVSTDPGRDTAPVIRSYLDRFDPSYVGLRADVHTVEAAAASLHIAYEGKEPTTGGGYEVVHGTYVTGFVDGRAKIVWSAETSVADLRADLSRLVRT